MVFPGENWIIWVVFVPVVHHLPASCRWKATHVSGGWFILTPLGRRLKMVSFWKEGPGCFCYIGKIIVKSNFYCSASILLFFKNNFSQQQSQRNPGKSWRGWLFPSAAVKSPSAPRVAVAQTNEAPSAHFLFFYFPKPGGKNKTSPRDSEHQKPQLLWESHEVLLMEPDIRGSPVISHRRSCFPALKSALEI